jgi:hypothetical protein
LLAAVRRECRGLSVCATTGVVLARRLPKFFNVDELEETTLSSLQPGGEATCKADGSLVSPFIVNGALRWALKSSLCPAVEAFVQTRSDITSAVMSVIQQGCTPIFEWCDTGPPVGVIQHVERRLLLLAVRNMTTGEFWPRSRLEALGCCESVDVIPFEDLDSLLSATRSTVKTEGVVVFWPDLGRMVKIKSTWWIALSAAQHKGSGDPALALHCALQSVPLSSVPHDSIWQAVLGADDDQRSLIYGVLTPEAQSSLRAFVAAVERGIETLHQELCEWGEEVREASDFDIHSIATGWPKNVLLVYQQRNPTAQHQLRRLIMRLAGSGNS